MNLPLPSGKYTYGLTIRLGLFWTDFWPFPKKLITQCFCRRDYLGSVQTISVFFWIIGALMRVVDISSLKLCGIKLRTLWRRWDWGSPHISWRAHQKFYFSWKIQSLEEGFKNVEWWRCLQEFCTFGGEKGVCFSFWGVFWKSLKRCYWWKKSHGDKNRKPFG